MTYDEAMALIRENPAAMVRRQDWDWYFAVRLDYSGQLMKWELDNGAGNPSGSSWPYEPPEPEDLTATDWEEHDIHLLENEIGESLLSWDIARLQADLSRKEQLDFYDRQSLIDLSRAAYELRHLPAMLAHCAPQSGQKRDPWVKGLAHPPCWYKRPATGRDPAHRHEDRTGPVPVASSQSRRARPSGQRYRVRAAGRAIAQSLQEPKIRPLILSFPSACEASHPPGIRRVPLPARKPMHHMSASLK